MKSIILYSLVLFSSLSVYGQSYTGDTWDHARESQTANIKVLYYPGDAFAFKDAKGNLTGVEIEIMKQFIAWVKNAKGIQINVEWIEINDFNEMFKSISTSSGGVFGAGNVTITNSRKDLVQFSDPYINNIAVLITNEDAEVIKSLNDAKKSYSNYRAVVHKETIHVDRMNELKKKYIPNLSITEVDNHQQALDYVVQNPESLTYIDLYNYWLAKTAGLPIKRVAVGDQSSEEFGFIMPLDSDWAKVLHEFFSIGSGYRSNVIYKKTLVRFLGSEVTKMLELARKNQSNS